MTVCHFSDWSEVEKLKVTLSSTVIEKTKAHFARYGVPAVCHIDNGPQFISEDNRKFSVEYGFKHTTSSPYHPKGNGRAEAAVKVTESMLKEADDFHSTMLLYRNTQPQGHTYSPAQRMLLRRTRTTLLTTDRLLTPTMLDSKKRCDSKTYDKSATNAYAKPPPHQREKPWIYGEVINHENPRSVLDNPHCSRPHDSKEQSPTKACSPTFLSPSPSRSRNKYPSRKHLPETVNGNCRANTVLSTLFSPAPVNDFWDPPSSDSSQSANHKHRTS